MLRVVPIAIGALLLGGCSDTQEDHASRGSEAALVPFDSLFPVSRSITLEVDSANPLASPAQVVFDRGQFLIPDRIQSDVKIYDRSGRRVRVIGGPGDGPGEFRAPSLVTRGGDRLAVLSSGGRLTWFDSSGVLISTETFAGHLPSSMAWDEDSQSLLVAARGGGEQFADGSIYVVTSTGKIRESHFERPQDARPYEFDMARGHLALLDHTVGAIHESDNELFLLDLANRTTRRVRLPLPGYRTPDWPEQPFSQTAEHTTWMHDQTWLHGIWALSGEHFLIGMRHPRSADGLLRTSYSIVSGSGEVLRSSPPDGRVVVTTRDSLAYSIEFSDAGVWSLTEHLIKLPRPTP